MKISIETISHNDQRYETVGDWITPEEVPETKEDVRILVSKVPDERMCFLIAVHELVEWYLARDRGIAGRSVTVFDTWFEENRADMEKAGIFEPGDHPQCPVYHEHQAASVVERLLALLLNVEWRHYERVIEKLSQDK